jgi:hypothetical protein
MRVCDNDMMDSMMLKISMTSMVSIDEKMMSTSDVCFCEGTMMVQ